MSTSQDPVQLLAEKLTHYILLYQKCSDKLRPLGITATNLIYDEVIKLWLDDPLYLPPLGDNEAFTAFLAKCDAICNATWEAQDDKEVYKISFAAIAGAQVIQSKLLTDMPITGNQVVVDACDAVRTRYLEEHPDIRVAMASNLSLLGNKAALRSYQGNDLVGRIIKFREQSTANIIECTILGYRTHFVKGDWYEVIFGEEERRVTETEMENMLDNLVESDFLESE